jgi:hypothetical protein
MIDPTSNHKAGFFRRIREFVSEDSSHLVLTVSPISLETGKLGSSFAMWAAQNCEVTR